MGLAVLMLVGQPVCLQAQPELSNAQWAAMQPVDPASISQFGTFWLAKGRDGAGSPPMPLFPPELSGLDVPVYYFGGDQYLIDDREVDYAAMDEQKQLESSAGPMMMMALSESIPSPDDGGTNTVDGSTNTVDGGTLLSFSGGHPLTTNDLYLTFANLGTGMAQLLVNAPNPDSYDLFQAATLDKLRTPTSWLWTHRTATDETNLTLSLPGANSGFFVLGYTNSTAGDGLSDSWKLLSGLDTNQFYDATIHFGMSFPGSFTSANVVTGTLQVISGFPSYMTVVVDPVDAAAFTNALWVPLTTNFPVALTNEGPHTVYVGLAGPLPTVAPAWQSAQLFLDQTPPAISLTSPTNSSAPFPMIQLEGFCNEPLADLRFSLSNALTQVANVPGFIKSQYYDPVQGRFTTNFWQCYDIDLDTNGGGNTLVLSATDLAGNVGAATFTFTFSTNNLPAAPAVRVLYPQPGMNLCGGSLTVRGQLDDPTAQVSATLVDANGTAAAVSGLVERYGQFWVEQMPLLTGGTNTLVLTATDVAGHSTVTNISFVKSDLALTVDPVPDNQLHLPATTVTGTVQDDSYAVWVNGVQAEVQAGGFWSASNVPVESGGTASFHARAYPAGEHPAAGSGGAGVNPPSAQAVDTTQVEDKKPQVRVQNYTVDWVEDDEHAPMPMAPHREYHLRWQDWAPSTAYQLDQYTNHACRTDFTWYPDICVLHEQDPVLSGFQTNNCTGMETMAEPPQVRVERCTVADTRSTTNGGVIAANNYRRHAQTTLQLVTGGKPLSHAASQFRLSATATSVTNPRWPVEGDFSGDAIPASSLVLGAFGSLPADGVLYRMLPDNSTNDVTVALQSNSSGTNFYLFDVLVEKP